MPEIGKYCKKTLFRNQEYLFFPLIFCVSFFLQNILCNPEHHCEMDADSSHLLQRELHQRKCCGVLSLPSTHMLLSPLPEHTQTLWFPFPFSFLFCVCKHRQGAQLLDGNSYVPQTHTACTEVWATWIGLCFLG